MQRTGITGTVEDSFKNLVTVAAFCDLYAPSKGYQSETFRSLMQGIIDMAQEWGPKLAMLDHFAKGQKAEIRGRLLQLPERNANAFLEGDDEDIIGALSTLLLRDAPGVCSPIL